MEEANKPLSQLSPREIERQIDELITELGREGGEYETLPPCVALPWYKRLVSKICRKDKTNQHINN